MGQTAWVWAGGVGGGRNADGGGGGCVCVGGVETVARGLGVEGRGEGEAAESPQRGCCGPPEREGRG